MKDRDISCIQCGTPFVFAISEQERFFKLSFDTPKRCPDCRKNKSKMTEADETKNNRHSRKQNRGRKYKFG